jgi:D-apionolactonase
VAFTPSQLRYGRPRPLPRVRAFRIGSLELELDGVDVARVRWGSTELVNRIYMSVRDRNWDTVLPEVSDLTIDRGDGRLEVRFAARNRAADIDFTWHGSITASADGSVDYVMTGRAESDFQYCRIGFCVLHGERVAAGRPYRAETPDGVVSGELPRLIAPQEIVDGRELPLIPPCSSLEVDFDDVKTRLAFEGSLFSAEDQRNWTDASFKTCCVAGDHYPYPAGRGQAFEGRVRLTTTGAPTAGPPTRSTRPRPLEVAPGSGLAWPAIGLGTPERSRGLPRPETTRLARLSLDHLRVDLHVGTPTWLRTLRTAAATAEGVGARLEIALFLDDAGIDRLPELRDALSELPVTRVIVLPEWTPEQRTTPVPVVDAVRRALLPAIADATFGGGTDGDFAELNRDRPSMDGWDAVSYSVNPQVHAFDNRSLAETLATQATTIETARSFAGPRAILVGPVTLRQRFNPSAIEEPTIGPGETPASVDVRQLSLFGAGWTLGSIASLTRAGAASITYFETIGWRGVLDSPSERRPGGPFPVPSRIVYPMYHVFADLADRAAFQPLLLTPQADDLVGLAMTDGDRVRVLVANLGPARVTLAIGPFGGGAATVRVVDDRSGPAALVAPGRFRRSRDPLAVRAGQVRCTLEPFAYARVDGWARPDSPRR